MNKNEKDRNMSLAQVEINEEIAHEKTSCHSIVPMLGRARVMTLASLLCISVYPFQSVAEGVVLWNKLGSVAEITNSEVGPGLIPISYKISDWEQAMIVPSKFGNGLFINQGIDEGWDNFGANFFAADLSQTNLTPARGTIEFWFKFKYDASTHNHAYFFENRNQLMSHYPNQNWVSDGTLSAGWGGWDYGTYGKRFFFCAGNKTGSTCAATPNYSAAPGGELAFIDGTMMHFAFVWDVSGIAGTSDTLRIYVNGEVKGSSKVLWPAASTIDPYLFIGSPSNCCNWDTTYNAVKGVTDNLVIWNYAKTDFSDRFNENPVGQTFSTFTPSASMTLGSKPHADSFKVSAKFNLGTENNGIDPISEDVSITFGSFSTMIPAGEFQQQGLGLFTFEGTINKIDLRAHIHMPQNSSPMSYLFSLDATGADLDGTVLPPEVKFTIGDDTGQAKLNGGKAQFAEGIGVPGDVNGDGTANCNDLKIVKLSFGKKTSQAGFDPRADLNYDGIIDVNELAIVSRQLPNGTVCK